MIRRNRFDYRPWNGGECRLMKNDFNTVTCLGYRCRFGNVAFHEFQTIQAFEIFALTSRKIIDSADRVSLFKQPLCNGPSDKPRDPSNEKTCHVPASRKR